VVRPLSHYVPFLKAGTLLETVKVPVLVWHATREAALTNTRDFTRPHELAEGVIPTEVRTANAVVFELDLPDKPEVRFTVGRSSDSTIQILNDSISRKHLELSRTRHGWSVSDLGSKNGTWAGSSRLPAVTPVSLADGTRLQLGDVELFFMSPESFQQYLSQALGVASP
jgi:pSer/pThr/pTyr-binding forkhead associated (FHA) protein